MKEHNAQLIEYIRNNKTWQFRIYYIDGSVQFGVVDIHIYCAVNRF